MGTQGRKVGKSGCLVETMDVASWILGGEEWLKHPGENAKSAMNGSIRHSQISGGVARNTELN